jgi:hypothetical protein
MNLEIAALEPAAAALREVDWLGYLGNSEYLLVKLTSPGLAAHGHRQLNMLQARDPHRGALSHDGKVAQFECRAARELQRVGRVALG